MIPDSIVVSGASSGIGRAFAIRCAATGVTLGLIGRNPERLEAVAGRCRAGGATVRTIAIDVRERERLSEWLLAHDAEAPVQLVVANAGVALAAASDPADPAVFDEIAINLMGSLHTVLPLLPAMRARGRGQIALMSSLAAIAPLPDAAAYSAAKAAILAFGLALRQRVGPDGIRVSVICPGFVATNMGEQYQGWRPLEMSADEAALAIERGLARDQAVIAFPRTLHLATQLSALAPEPLVRLAMSAFRFRFAKG